jgi:hypothetical protein
MLRRVALIAGHATTSTPEQRQAARALGNALGASGVTVLHQAGPSDGAAADLLDAHRAAGGQALSSDAPVVGANDAYLALPGQESLGALLARGLPDDGADRPCGLLDVDDHFSRLLASGADAELEQVVRETQRGRLIRQRDPLELLRALSEYRAPETRRQA